MVSDFRMAGEEGEGRDMDIYRSSMAVREFSPNKTGGHVLVWDVVVEDILGVVGGEGDGDVDA